MPSHTAGRLLRGFIFHPGGWLSIGYSRWRTTVPVSSPHSRVGSSRLSGACTEKTTPGTDWGWHSARKLSKGMAGKCGSNRPPARDRHSILLCRLTDVARTLEGLEERRVGKECRS